SDLVLQEQEFERLGSSRTVKTDVRLITATNCDLKQMVFEKKFRSDLYYRLNVFPVFVQRLRAETAPPDEQADRDDSNRHRASALSIHLAGQHPRTRKPH